MASSTYQKLRLAAHSAPLSQEQEDCTKTRHTIYDGLLNFPKVTACSTQCPTLSGATGLNKSKEYYILYIAYYMFLGAYLALC